jgi:hypothetical protein
MFAAVSDEGRLSLWDPESGKGLNATGEAKAPGAVAPILAIASDGKTAATCPLNRGVWIWDAMKGERVRFLQTDGDNYLCTAFSPDGKTLACGGPTAAIRIWNVEKDDESRVLPGHRGGGVLGVAYSPDGKTLASVGRDDMLRVWDVEAGTERRSPCGHPAWVRCVAYSPNGRFLVTGADDGVIRVWAAGSGRLLHELTGHRGGVGVLAFADNGKTLLSGGDDSTVLVWDAAGLLRDEKPSPVKLTEEQLEAHWKALAGEDAAAASHAEQVLARAAEQALPKLRQRVQPLDAEKVKKWIHDLDDDAFATRQTAQRELEQLGRAVAPALRRALEGDPSVELMQRVKELLAHAEAEGNPALTQALRAVEVLEMIGDKDAEAVLRQAAEGPDDFTPTLKAKAALERMKGK